jgi:hypothetical protein
MRDRMRKEAFVCECMYVYIYGWTNEQYEMGRELEWDAYYT